MKNNLCLRKFYHLINKLTAVDIIVDKHLGPEILLAAFGQIPGLLFERGIIVGGRDELAVAEAFSISNVCKVRVACFTELANYERFVWLLMTKHQDL